MNEHDARSVVPFDLVSPEGPGRKIVAIQARHRLYLQGTATGQIFYIRSGRVKLTVVSGSGKEATLALLTAGDFVGEESLAGKPGIHLATATAITGCVVLRIERNEMVRLFREDPPFTEIFLRFMIVRGIRMQHTLADQLSNSSEKRLARLLLSMAETTATDEPEGMIPQVTQATLAEMTGITRSRVSYFMNRFRERGFIAYNGRIRIDKSRLSVVLRHQEQDGLNTP